MSDTKADFARLRALCDAAAVPMLSPIGANMFADEDSFNRAKARVDALTVFFDKIGNPEFTREALALLEEAEQTWAWLCEEADEMPSEGYSETPARAQLARLRSLLEWTREP